MDVRGINQAQIAREIQVSPAAVSKWFRGDDFPRPDKLLKLGRLLNLDFSRIVAVDPDPELPVIAFRKKGQRKTKPAHVERAIRMGRHLRGLVEHLPTEQLRRPPVLKDPDTGYEYLQRVSQELRRLLGTSPHAPIDFRDLIDWFGKFDAVLVPVFWGDAINHENALHIHLPDSGTTWVYLNLDAHIHDFNFWMAHELGHIHAPELLEDEGEDFADAFAQALLFPESCAAEAHAALSRRKNVGFRINKIKEYAAEYLVSPVTVNLAVGAYARQHDKDPVHVGKEIHPANTIFQKKMGTVTNQLFPHGPIEPSSYIEVARDIFQSPFFDAVQRYLRKTGASTGFVQEILQVPPPDAKALIAELE